MKAYPLSVYRVATTFDSYIVLKRVLKAKVVSTISEPNWYGVRNTDFGSGGDAPKVDVIAVDVTATDTLKGRKTLSRKETEIQVSFKPKNKIPADGSITIEFKFGQTGSLTRIYPNCRSAVAKGSLLYSN